jgi:hypothetical protein
VTGQSWLLTACGKPRPAWSASALSRPEQSAEIPNIHWLPARFSAIIGRPDPFGVDFIQTP